MANTFYHNGDVGSLDTTNRDDDQWIEFGVNSRCELRCFEVEVSGN